MRNIALVKLIGAFKALFRRRKIVASLGSDPDNRFDFFEDIDFCHRDKVHIFVRGLADEKLHVAKNRNYSDLRFYKKQNLKVFCATCRKRLI